MPKGISLEQFKNEFESDAQKRCIAQEKTIKQLHDQLKDKDHKMTVLMNRCFAMSMGKLCFFCGVKSECKSGKW